MWVKITRNYTGPLGMFTEGTKIDLPKATVKKLGNRYCQKSCPPWEAETNPKVVKINEHQQWIDIIQTDIKKNTKQKELLTERIASRLQAIEHLNNKGYTGLLKQQMIKLNEADQIGVKICDYDIANANKKLESLQAKLDKLQPPKKEEPTQDGSTAEPTKTSEANNDTDQNPESEEPEQQQEQTNDNSEGQTDQANETEEPVQD